MQGYSDRYLNQLAACGPGGRGYLNASRNLHRLIHREGRCLNVNVNSVWTPVRFLRKGKVRKESIGMPVLMPSSWLRYSLSVGGEAFFAGECLDAEASVQQRFRSFWRKFQAIDPSFPFFQRADYQDVAGLSVPILIHGDEGRGSCKRPIMCISIQPLIGLRGLQEVNMRLCLVNQITIN